MSKAFYFICLTALFTACNYRGEQIQSSKWNDGYDPNHSECFDTVICENGDSLLIINIATDSIL